MKLRVAGFALIALGLALVIYHIALRLASERPNLGGAVVGIVCIFMGAALLTRSRRPPAP